MDCTCHTKSTPSTTCAELCIRQRCASVVAAAVAAVGASGAAVGGAAVAVAAGLVAAAAPCLLLTSGQK